MRDANARARIRTRIRRLSVGSGISEMRIDYGPGYRVYFTQRGTLVILLLCGGNKRTQQQDIERAKAIAAEWKD